MQRGDASRFDVVVAALAGIASVVLVIGTLAVEQIRVTHEVQLWTPPTVQRGDPVPLRVRVIGDLESGDGARIVVPRVRASASEDPRTEGETEDLREASLETLEGELPSAAQPTALVRVEAVGPTGEWLATARQPAVVVERVGRADIQARVADGLQVLSIARPPEIEAALPDLDVRVEGGVCVPEHRCVLWFRRGASEAVPHLGECTPLDVGETTVGRELVSIAVVVHGPEARCHVDFEPLGVGTELQLPVGLATPWIDVARDAERGRLIVRGEPPVGREGMLIDVYAGHRWVMSRSMRRGAALEIDGVAGPDLWLVQARADIASSERGYQRVLVGTDASAEIEAVLGPGWSQLAEPSEAQRWARLSLETDLLAIPQPVSGFADDEARLADVRSRMRLLCAIGVLLAIGAILGLVARRGLASAREARAVLLEAGAEHADDRSARWRSWLTVAGFVCAIALAILLGGAFLVARPYFMG